MNSMLRWSPTRQFHFHQQVEDVLPTFFEGAPPADAQRDPSWSPAVEGRIEDGAFVIRLAVPGVDPKDVTVSLMENLLTVKGERRADQAPAAQHYFVRELSYGRFQRTFELPEGVDAAHVEAKHANGMLELRVPAPRVATPRLIEVKAA